MYWFSSENKKNIISIQSTSFLEKHFFVRVWLSKNILCSEGIFAQMQRRFRKLFNSHQEESHEVLNRLVKIPVEQTFSETIAVKKWLMTMYSFLSKKVPAYQK